MQVKFYDAFNTQEAAKIWVSLVTLVIFFRGISSCQHLQKPFLGTYETRKMWNVSF